MISTQPVFSLRYFKFKRNNLPIGLKKLFYLSWEDAFWDLIDKKRIPLGSNVLVPDFFCGDVEKNIENHGLKIKRYSVDSKLVPSEISFLKQLKKYQPSVVVIFHSVGIKNKLLNKKIITKVSEKTVLIEDCVHMVIDPSKLRFLKRNHFIIDSLRKVIPLQGSNIYGMEKDMDFDTPRLSQSFLYSVKVHFLWFLMMFSWIFNLNAVGEKLMLKGYDLIGDSYKSSRGLGLFSFLSERLNIELISKIKKSQADTYEKNIKQGHAQFTKNEAGSLRGWPLILDNKNADKFLKNVRRKGLLLRFELNDSNWSKKHKIVFLPMGLHINRFSQEDVIKAVNESYVV